jgi:ArsR family transcriptional regulator
MQSAAHLSEGAPLVNGLHPMNLDTEVFDLQAELCLAMGHPIRLRIVHLLKEGPQRVAGIAESLGVAQAAASRHLAVLRNAGIVFAERHAQESIYQIANPKIVSVCEMMREVLAEREGRRSEVLSKLRA